MSSHHSLCKGLAWILDCTSEQEIADPEIKLSTVALLTHTAFASISNFVYSLVLLPRLVGSQREEDLAAGEDKSVMGYVGGHLMLLPGLEHAGFLLCGSSNYPSLFD